MPSSASAACTAEKEHAVSSTTASHQPQQRRSQAERSECMRTRLVEAAVEVLADDGYATASLSAIVRRARVSRGAQCHHYPSKQALFVDVVEHLAANVHRELRTALIPEILQRSPEDALHLLWSRFFSTDLFRAYTELAIAGRHEHQIAAALRRTWPAIYEDGNFLWAGRVAKNCESSAFALDAFLYLCGLGLHMGLLADAKVGTTQVATRHPRRDAAPAG